MRKTLVPIAFGLSSLASAESFIYESNLKIDQVFAGYENEMVIFKVDRAVSNPNNCSDGGDTLLGVDPARSNSDQVLSVLLYAHATQNDVSIQIYDSSCADNHRVIRRVMVD